MFCLFLCCCCILLYLTAVSHLCCFLYSLLASHLHCPWLSRRLSNTSKGGRSAALQITVSPRAPASFFQSPSSVPWLTGLDPSVSCRKHIFADVSGIKDFTLQFSLLRRAPNKMYTCIVGGWSHVHWTVIGIAGLLDFLLLCLLEQTCETCFKLFWAVWISTLFLAQTKLWFGLFLVWNGAGWFRLSDQLHEVMTGFCRPLKNGRRGIITRTELKWAVGEPGQRRYLIWGLTQNAEMCFFSPGKMIWRRYEGLGEKCHLKERKNHSST